MKSLFFFYRLLALFLIVSAALPLLAQSENPASAAQSQDPPSSAEGDDVVVAEMEGYKLTKGEADRLIASLGPRVSQQLADQEQRQDFIRRWMEVKAIAREAEAAGIDQEQAFQRQMEIRRTQYLAEYYRDKVSKTAEVSEEDLQAYYEENKEYFRHPVMVRLNRILVASEEAALKVVEDLRAGADFAETAQVRSKGQNRDRGGLMGWIHPGQLEAAIEQVAFGLEEGEISEPIRTVRGWHILMVDGKRSPGYLTLDDIRDTLRQQLLRLKQKEESDELVRRAAEKHNVQLHFEEEGQQESPPGP